MSEILDKQEFEKSFSPTREYFQQLFPTPPIICGRQLLPLSIGRYRLMARFNVAYCADEIRTATAGDLLMGVIICSMTVKEFLIFAAQKDLVKAIRNWGMKIGFFKPEFSLWPRQFVLWIFRKAWPEFYDDRDVEYLRGEMMKFQKYIEDNSRTPDYWDVDDEKTVSAAHWSQSIEVTLRGALGWSEEEVNERPLGNALWDCFKHYENLGLISFMTAEEIAEHSKPKTPEEIKSQNDAAAKIIAFQKGDS